MKMLIASDLHGSAYYCKKLLERLEAEGNPTLFLLGDILYHGPRNDLPEDYAPKKVIELLDPLKDNILCVRGNCDGEIDQKVLGFSILSEYALINDSGLKIYAARGHRCGESDPPPMAKGSVLLCGHTHVPAFNRHEGFIYVNPGSLSIPKEGSAHGYILYEDGAFCHKDLDGNIIWNEKI